MATLSVFWYTKGNLHFKQGDIDFVTDTIKAALTTSVYTPNQDTHEFFDTHVTNEVSGTGYTAGGATLAGKTLAQGAGADAHRVTLDANDVAWDPSTITARNVVVYKVGTAGVDDYVIGFGTLAADESSDDAAFTVTWNANGILRTNMTQPA